MATNGVIHLRGVVVPGTRLPDVEAIKEAILSQFKADNNREFGDYRGRTGYPFKGCLSDLKSLFEFCELFEEWQETDHPFQKRAGDFRVDELAAYDDMWGRQICNGTKVDMTMRAIARFAIELADQHRRKE